MLIFLRTGMVFCMNKETFDKWLALVPWEDKEPFCPFKFFGYCDAAYSESCFTCEYFDEEVAYVRLRKN